MCDTCGCSTKQSATLTVVNDSADEQSQSAQRVDVVENKQRVTLSQSLLSANDRIAAHNREHFKRQGIVAINMISAPGSGKTSLLEATLTRLFPQVSCAVIEGDQATLNDAQRIKATGVPVIQVNTGAGCHLEANMVHEACHQLPLHDHSLLFIENVGNLVCPSLFDLGEAIRVVLLSVTEGDDKPLKYPQIFRESDVVVINKMDLLPYVPFDLAQCKTAIHQLNPKAEILEVAALKPETLSPWLVKLQSLVAADGC